jgi:hypothetical protein
MTSTILNEKVPVTKDIMTGVQYGHIRQFLFPLPLFQRVLGPHLRPPFGTSDVMTTWSNTLITQSSYILLGCNLDLDWM